MVGDCCVCHEPLTHDVVALPGCGHVLHVACALTNAQYNVRCPMCRRVPDGVQVRTDDHVGAPTTVRPRIVVEDDREFGVRIVHVPSSPTQMALTEDGRTPPDEDEEMQASPFWGHVIRVTPWIDMEAYEHDDPRSERRWRRTARRLRTYLRGAPLSA